MKTLKRERTMEKCLTANARLAVSIILQFLNSIFDILITFSVPFSEAFLTG